MIIKDGDCNSVAFADTTRYLTFGSFIHSLVGIHGRAWIGETNNVRDAVPYNNNNYNYNTRLTWIGSR
jgi:hypothetical protein